jgi:hypothetical protein
MKELLEELWFEYQSDKNLKPTEEEDEIAKRLGLAEVKLNDTLSKEQVPLVDELDGCYHEMNLICSKNAFCIGVTFATKYLLEILYDKENT